FHLDLVFDPFGLFSDAVKRDYHIINPCHVISLSCKHLQFVSKLMKNAVVA
uniref:Uncharacterized protein n=1 Tax=Oryza brachyantha TaxID=4533 RepID=J3M6G3_ORYBR